MNDDDVVKAVQTEIDRARSFMQVRIDYERALAYDYYYGRPFGNEMEGRSQVISADVAQSVDAAVPPILEVFISGDEAVEFTPRNQEDVPAAEQATLGANYVFFTQNNGYALAHDFVKDGLLQKTGAFKWKWDTSVAMRQKRYQGLDWQTLQVLASNPDVELVGHTAYPNPGMPPQAGGQEAGPETMLHDVVVQIKKTAGKVKITVPAPEDILISPDSMGLDVMDMPFIAHTPLVTSSDLVEMGIPQKVIDELPKGDRVPDIDRIAREGNNDSTQVIDGESDDGYRYNECYIRLDVDGDGIAELRNICLVGTQILHNEPTDHIPISLWTPKVMPHEVVGVSLADDVMDLQLLKSTVWRMTMDSWYQSVYPRMFTTGDVNMDDILTLKPGGAIRGAAGSTLTPIEVPFVGQAGFQVLEYTDQEKDARVGFSALGPGMDPDSINKTATYVTERSNQTNARAKIIARNAAEFGFKPLFRGIMYLMAKHQTQALMVRLNNKFVPIDPETWDKEYDMSCNVGLGVGNKDQQLMHLQALGQDLAMIAQSPYASVLLGPDKIYNYFEKKANLAGFKDASLFLNNPIGPDGKPIQPPPQPNPMVQAEQVKAGVALQTAQIKAQTDQASEQARANADMQVQQHKIQSDAQLEVAKTRMQLQLDDIKHSREQQTALQVANIKGAAQIESARVSAKVSDGAALEQQDARNSGP